MRQCDIWEDGVQCAYAHGHGGSHVYPSRGEDLSNEIRLRVQLDRAEKDATAMRKLLDAGVIDAMGKWYARVSLLAELGMISGVHKELCLAIEKLLGQTMVVDADPGDEDRPVTP